MISNKKIPDGPSPIKKWFKKKRTKFTKLPWQIWAIFLIAVSGGLGFTAISNLFFVSKAPNCPKIFWPTASASLRIYCAQIDAQAGTLEGLLQAIQLVQALPLDHPLRPEIDRSLEDWSTELLKLAEKEFQEGKLNQAIKIAQNIPVSSKAHQDALTRITKWQDTWKTGTDHLVEIDKQLRESNWDYALRLAIEILNIKNKYWSTVQYDIAIKKVQLAQQQSEQINLASDISNQGGLENLLKSLDQASEIPPDSYVYKQAQELIQKNKTSIVDLVDSKVEEKNWSKVQSIVNLIGTRPALKDSVDRWVLFLNAIASTSIDNPDSFQNAIVALQKIQPGDRLYGEARSFIDRWQLEASDLVFISKSNELASMGTIDDYQNAIVQLSLIPFNNPRYHQAQETIGKYQASIETIEDQPILNRALTTARGGEGNIALLRIAITQAQAINPGRALYREAQNNIAKWQDQIYLIQDQPIYDRASSLADNKNYAEAIETAQGIRSGHPLYQDIQQKLSLWRREMRAGRNLDRAYEIASTRTAENLAQAISLAQNIPSYADAAPQAKSAIELWSSQLLNIARDRADQTSYQEAIRIAKLIPHDSDVYSSAQSEIDRWLKEITPSSPNPEPDLPSTTTP